MGINGDTTISALQSATGINTSSLFDFGAGSPSKVYFSDFLCTELGMPRTDTTAGWDDAVELISQDNCLSPGATFTVRIYANVNLAAYDGGGSRSFYAQQILQDRLSITAPKVTVKSLTPGHTTVSNPTREVDYVDIVFEVKADGYGSTQPQVTPDEAVNTDVSQMSTTLLVNDVDTGGSSVSGVNSNGVIQLLKEGPLWESIIVEKTGDSSGFYDYEVTVTLHDPNDNLAEGDRRYVLFIPTDPLGDNSMTKSPPNTDTETFTNSVSTTPSTYTFEIELEETVNNTEVDALAFDADLDGMAVGDTAQVTWDECSDTYNTNTFGSNVYRNP